jgi:hypothetical protein
VLVLFLEPAGLQRFLTMTQRKGVNLTKKGVNLKFPKRNSFLKFLKLIYFSLV